MNNAARAPLRPRCTFLTGPAGMARQRWMETHIREQRAALPTAPGSVLLADTSFATAREFAKRNAGLDVQWLPMPCSCCPWLSDLPRVARKAAEVTHAEWIVIDAPPLAAAGLLAEFDRVLGWPRDVVVWLNREWSRARTAGMLSPFQTTLLALATRIVEEPGPSATPADGPTLSLFQPPP